MKFVIVACSVCFGDPNSTLTKAAQAGVLFLMAVIGVVLVGIALTAFSWMKKARTGQTPSD